MTNITLTDRKTGLIVMFQQQYELLATVMDFYGNDLTYLVHFIVGVWFLYSNVSLKKKKKKKNSVMLIFGNSSYSYFIFKVACTKDPNRNLFYRIQIFVAHNPH